MINFKKLTALSDFENLKKGDVVAVEWRRDVLKSRRSKKRTRFATYEISDNLERQTEIILEKSANIYFNYSMFLNPDEHGVSNVREIALLTSE